MLKKIFKNSINYPYFYLFGIILLTLFFINPALKLSVDASADTLMLDNDKDLAFSRQVSKTYQTDDFLFIAFSPKDELLSQNSLQTIKEISHELTKINGISKTTSILNVPLLQSPPIKMSDLVKKVPTLQDSDINKTLAKQEFLSSPFYKNNLVSLDFKTTAIVAWLQTNHEFNKLIEEQNNEKDINKQKQIKEKLNILREEIKNNDHDRIIQVRKVLKKYQNQGNLYVGGVTLIADDMITYVKNDIIYYGSSLALLLMLSVWIFFRQLKYVFLVVLTCFISVILSSGLISIFGWKITVISSNYISFQLIITVSVVLHLIVRYRELANKYTKTNNKKLILLTMLSKSTASFLAILTTIMGFLSLVFSNIKPIINLGLMMSLGISISLIIAFFMFSTLMSITKKTQPLMIFEKYFKIAQLCIKIILNNAKSIIFVAIIVSIIGAIGSSQLIVENSFINYFKKSTDIYKGMEIIDKKLGGTTPLEVIVDFKEKKQAKTDDFLDEFEDEFAKIDDKDYWFSRDKMQIVLKIHDYLENHEFVGYTQSLATLLKAAKVLNNGKYLDDLDLALAYKELPDEYKDIIFKPYVNIEKNQVRFNLRFYDSDPNLRRDKTLNDIHGGLEKLLKNDNVSFKLTGLMVLYNNMLQSLFQSQFSTLGLVIFLLFATFFVIFKSIKLSLIAIVSNIIPLSLVFAIMGFFHIPLDIMSITIAAICMGIGIDDTIHYTHRFQDELRKTKDYQQALINSHLNVGYAMYYTSFAIILGFCVLMVSNFIPTIYFGFLTVLAMLFALTSALLLLPKMILMFKPFKIN